MATNSLIDKRKSALHFDISITFHLDFHKFELHPNMEIAMFQWCALHSRMKVQTVSLIKQKEKLHVQLQCDDVIYGNASVNHNKKETKITVEINNLIASSC